MIFQSSHKHIRRFIIGSLALIMIVLAPSLYGTGVSEDEVKAAFIFNFARFVEWPEQKSAEVFLVGYVGEKPLSGNLQLLKGRRVQEKPIDVRQFNQDQAFQYDLVFVSAEEFGKKPEILSDFNDHAILTVSDAPGFVSSGGMIGLIIVDKKVRFDINHTAAREQGLRVSSQLLSLARTVKK